MALKYYDATKKIKQPNPKASYYADYAAIMDFGFENAPNVIYDEIEYEKTYGKEDFELLGRVRVDTILNYNTGIILGDDYKMFVFPPEFKITPYYGMKFKWKDSYWLVINTNSYGSLSNSAEVRRCNNVLRYFSKDGKRIYEPCIVDYTLRFTKNEENKEIVISNNEQKVWCQRNDKTKQIKPNYRFLFGTPEQRVAFRLYGSGTKNYLNGVTMDDNSPTISEFYLDHYEVNELFDDFENGFADAYLNEVKIVINNLSSSLSVGESDILEASVYKGQKLIPNAEIIWSVSDDSILEIIDNKLTAKAIGQAEVIATLKNTEITTKASINVVNTPVVDEFELIVEPNVGYVLQNKSQRFNVNLYKNGVKQNDIISFQDISVGIPTGKYRIEANQDNSFVLYNKGMYMAKPVIIRCVSDKQTMDLKIMLRGLY